MDKKLIWIGIIFDMLIFGILIPVLFISISKLIDSVFLLERIDFIFLKYIAGLLICAGFVFIAWAYYLIVKVGKGYTLEFFGRKFFLPVTKNLVKTGPYSKIRHPMALGYLIFLGGIGFISGYLSSIFLVLPLVFILTILYLIFFEERFLEERFGQEFKDYKANTNLIIPNHIKRGQK